MGFQIYKNLARIDKLPVVDAEAIFLKCSGSKVWARQMTESRPFKMVNNILSASERSWGSLSRVERLAAFSVAEPVHIPQKEIETSVLESLRQVESLYADKFGFIFIVEVGNRSAEELVAICKARLGNSVETELAIAAEEFRKILESRLSELLEQ